MRKGAVTTAAVHAIPTHGRSRAAPPALTLTDEHSPLSGQAGRGAEGALAVIVKSRRPRWVCAALIGGPRAEVLRQAGDDERLLFSGREAEPRFARSSRDDVHCRRTSASGRSWRPAGTCRGEARCQPPATSSRSSHITSLPKQRCSAAATVRTRFRQRLAYPAPPDGRRVRRRHAGPAPGPEHATGRQELGQVAILLPAGLAWVRSSRSTPCRRWLSRAPGVPAGGDEGP